MPGQLTYGRDYEEQGAEMIVSRYLRRPVGWIVIVGSGNACLVPSDKVAYRRFSGPNFESLIELWGPPEIIADLKERKCQVSTCNTEEATTRTGESNQ